MRFSSLVRVGSRLRANVSVLSAQPNPLAVESVFALTYEIDGEELPTCVAGVIVLYP